MGDSSHKFGVIVAVDSRGVVGQERQRAHHDLSSTLEMLAYLADNLLLLAGCETQVMGGPALKEGVQGFAVVDSQSDRDGDQCSAPLELDRYGTCICIPKEDCISPSLLFNTKLPLLSGYAYKSLDHFLCVRQCCWCEDCFRLHRNGLHEDSYHGSADFRSSGDSNKVGV